VNDEPTYRSSHTRDGYGEYYDETIFSGYQGDVWARYEEPLLGEWLAAAVDGGATVALDFACGTGRVTEVVDRHFATTVGVDVSAEMLARARTRVPMATFIEKDLTAGDLSSIPRADVITSFRFFQNAEASLRHQVLDVFAEVLRDDGELIVNVQLNGEGPGGFVARGRHRFLGHAVKTMTHAELEGLLSEHGFAVVDTRWYGFWPRTGPYLADVAGRLQGPATRVVERLSLPERRCAEMFAVRVRRA